MVDKVIHYCWFGEKELPPEYKKYVEGWKKKFPDYQIIEWNEKNFPISEFKYAKQAYECKKYAFVSDVARIYALYNYGGIYFDTDVEVIKDFSSLLENATAVVGEESIEQKSFGTGFLFFEKKHKLMEALLNQYQLENFLLDSGELNTLPNTHRLYDLIKEIYNTEPNGINRQVDDLKIYSQEYFTAFDGFVGKTIITENTYCVHHFANSWSNKKSRFKNKLRIIFHRVLRFLKIK